MAFLLRSFNPTRRFLLPLLMMLLLAWNASAVAVETGTVHLYSPEHGYTEFEAIFSMQKSGAHIRSEPNELQKVYGKSEARFKRVFSSQYPDGALFHLEQKSANTQTRGGGVLWQGKAQWIESTFDCRALHRNDTIYAVLLDESQHVAAELAFVKGATLSGEKAVDYSRLVSQSAEEASRHVHRPYLMRSMFWNDYMERMLAITSSGQLRPLTFHHAFRVHSQDVPIPEFRIVRRRKGALPMPNVLYRQPRFHVRQEIETVAIDGESACIHFNHGEVSTEEIDAAFQKVKKGGYSKLVIDMRNNSGHQFSALRLAAHLTEEPIKAGFLVGRNWYRMRDPDIDIRELDRKPVFSSSDKTNFFDILEDKSAVKLQIQPAGNAFIGKVYVLVNKGTGLMNEAVIHVLQEKGLVRVAGVATDGGVYALRSIPLSRDWQVDIPVADYLTPDGRRMNKEGLTPDITFDAYQSDITTLIESPSAWLN